MKTTLKIVSGNILLMLPLIIIALGCRQFGESLLDNYFEGSNAKNAVEILKSKIGKPFNVVELIIEREVFVVQVQDPDKPQNLDSYSIKFGVTKGPSPVQLNVQDREVNKTSFPINEIDFGAIPNIIREAVEKADIEGGNVTRMTFRRAYVVDPPRRLGNQGEPLWFIDITGTRENIKATASPDGKIVRVKFANTSKSVDYLVLNDDELEKAQETFDEIDGVKGRLVEINIWKNSIRLDISSSDKKKITYIYGIDGISEEKSRMSPLMAPYQDFFSLSEIDLKQTLALIEKAKLILKMPNAEIESIKVINADRKFPPNIGNTQAEIQWSVSLRQFEDQGTVEFDNSGKEFRIVKNGEFLLKP